MHIGISGPIASGKSTLAKSLKAVFELLDIKTRIVPFAEDLKWMAGLYGRTDVIPQLLYYFRDLNYPEDKVWIGVAETLNAFMLYPPVDGIKPRKLYQYLGTEMGRNAVDTDLWVSAVQRRIKQDKDNRYFISDDLRFPNEATAVDFHVRITVDDNAAVNAGYEARKALYPPEYFFNDHESEQEVLLAPHYSIPTTFTTVEVVHLAKSINHKVRSNIILTQRDLPDAFRDFGTALGNVGRAMSKQRILPE